MYHVIVGASLVLANIELKFEPWNFLCFNKKNSYSLILVIQK
jgi:hypothetical protein